MGGGARPGCARLAIAGASGVEAKAKVVSKVWVWVCVRVSDIMDVSELFTPRGDPILWRLPRGGGVVVGVGRGMAVYQSDTKPRAEPLVADLDWGPPGIGLAPPRILTRGLLRRFGGRFLV